MSKSPLSPFNPDTAGDPVTEQQIGALLRQLDHLSAKTIVQGFALQAMAVNHPSKRAVAGLLRAKIDSFLATGDDAPIPQEIVDAALMEMNAFLEALGPTDLEPE